MAYILNGSTIKRPSSLITNNDDAITTNISLSGTVGRDWFYDKNTYILSYDIINTTDYNTLNTIYAAYKASGDRIRFQITDTNLDIDIYVHMDIGSRGYTISGEDYLAGVSISLQE